MNRKGNKTARHPIRKLSDIEKIKAMLYPHARNYALFVFGINTGYRANEIVKLKVRDVRNIGKGELLRVYQTKTKKYRSVYLNENVYAAVQRLIEEESLKDDDPLFKSNKESGHLTEGTVNRLMKKWCADVGLIGGYGSHTIRKTWGYQQRKNNNVPLHVLMVAFGHSTQRQTLNYLCIEQEEVEELYHFNI